MKKFAKGLVFALVLGGIVSVVSVFTFNATSQTTQASEKLEKVHLKIDGMTCGMCAGKLKVALDKVSDVKDSEVSYDHGTADLEVTKGSNHHALEEAITAAGHFKVVSLTCECKKH